MHQHETSLKINSIVIRADKTLLNAQKAESDHQRREKKNKASKKKEMLKTQSANFINTMIDDLIRKMKALALQISTMSEAITNQTRVLVLQRFCNASASGFSEVSRLKCFDCEKIDYSTIHCSSINVMCEKKLVHHDINERLY